MTRIKNALYRLLRWSETYLKTDTRYLASGSFWSAMGQIISALATLILAMAVGRFLPKEVYGEYKYIVAIIALLSTFSLNTLSNAVFQSTARGYDGALHEGFWANIRWSTFIFLGAFVLATYYYTLHNTTLALGVLIGGCLSPFLTSANLAGTYLAGKKDFVRQILYFDILETLISVSALVVTILLTKDPLIIAVVYFLSNTLATLYFYVRVIRIYKPDPTKADPGMLSYGKHLSVMGILSGIAGNIDQILLFHYMGSAELAIYNFATAIPDQTKGPIKTLDAMIQARFAHRPNIEIQGGMKNKMFWLFLSSALFVGLYALCAPWIYSIFFPNYTEAAHYSQIYALSLFSLVFTPAGSFLSIKKKVGALYVSNIVLSVLQIAAMLAGVLLWGLLGLILARVIFRIGGGYFTYFLYQFSIKHAPTES